MRQSNRSTAILLRIAASLAVLTLALILVGCMTRGTVMPNPAPGVAADRSVGTVIPVPDPIPHTLDGRQECFTCHAIGAVDAPPIPAGHEQDVTLCTTCHAVWLIPAIAVAEPPAIPHNLGDGDDCLMCHKLGTADAPRIPENHSGLASSICLACHESLGEVVEAGESETATPLAIEAPEISHDLEGRDDCLICHDPAGQIKPAPADHAERSKEQCQSCHEPAS